MSWFAPGVVAVGAGKLWPPVWKTAHSRVFPSAQDHVLRVMMPCLAVAGLLEHLRFFCNRAIWTVAGGVSLPFSPGL